MKHLIKNIAVVNEGKIFFSDVLISNQRIEKIASNITLPANAQVNEINGENLHLLPGCIDDQVHFREPGLTHKATIASESKAAAAGGITAFMDMPNTIPNTLTQRLLEEKYKIAAASSAINYSFFMGINQNNLEEALLTDPENVCGITDDGLYFNNDEGILANYPDFLEKLFSRTSILTALHSEDDSIIKKNTERYKKEFGDNIPFNHHHLIRTEEACVEATKRVLEIAKKHNNRLHFFHISTQKEASLFEQQQNIRDKRITAEACVHHLWFTDKDYDTLGSKIKWNPAVKTTNDKEGLIQALIDNKIDIIATDHAPHTIDEKSGNYTKAMSGGPLVQHALPALLELYHQNKLPLQKIVEKTSHHVAEIYRLKERGYIREGYYADMVMVDLNNSWTATKENLLYKCGWSPFENYTFKSKVMRTFVNGNVVYDNGAFNESNSGMRLKFERDR
jgi:dihydroorotase